MNGSLNGQEKASLERLIRIAQSDTGQSRIVANSLLAWWNARSCGGFDLTDLWEVDVSTREDMLTVLIVVIGQRRYPDDLGYGEQFESIVRAWRSSLVSKEG